MGAYRVTGTGLVLPAAISITSPRWRNGCPRKGQISPEPGKTHHWGGQMSFGEQGLGPFPAHPAFSLSSRGSSSFFLQPQCHLLTTSRTVGLTRLMAEQRWLAGCLSGPLKTHFVPSFLLCVNFFPLSHFRCRSISLRAEFSVPGWV